MVNGRGCINQKEIQFGANDVGAWAATFEGSAEDIGRLLFDCSSRGSVQGICGEGNGENA